jgi:biopolymer transport protein ExbD
MKRQPQRKKRPPPVIPTASMGDIAFLLLIFFVACSEPTKERSDLNVTPPVSEHVHNNKAPLAARVAIDKTGTIYFDGERVDNAKDIEWGVTAVLTRTVSDDQRHVQFRCDATLAKETFEPVIQAIVSAGGILEAIGEIK